LWPSFQIRTSLGKFPADTINRPTQHNKVAKQLNIWQKKALAIIGIMCDNETTPKSQKEAEKPPPKNVDFAAWPWPARCLQQFGSWIGVIGLQYRPTRSLLRTQYTIGAGHTKGNTRSENVTCRQCRSCHCLLFSLTLILRIFGRCRVPKIGYI